MKVRLRDFYAGLTIALVLVLAGILGFWFYQTNRPVLLRLSAGQPGGLYLPLAHAIAEVVQRESPRIKIEVVESAGSIENLERMDRGLAELALVQNDSIGNDRVRTLVPLHFSVLHFLVLENSEIRSINDLRGKRVATGMEQSGSSAVLRHLFRHYELDIQEIDLASLTIEEACEQLKENKVDAVLMMLGLKSASLEKLVEQRKVRFVGIGDTVGVGSEIEGFRLVYPFIRSFVIPKYTYSPPKEGKRGVPDQAIPAVGVKTVLVSQEDLPREVARALTKVIIENRTSLIRIHRSAVQISEKFDTGQLQFPLHKGSQTYYRRNEPGFFVKYAEVMAFGVSLLAMLIGIFATARRWFIQQQKDRIDEYYITLNEYLERIREGNLSLNDLEKIKTELSKIQRTALQQLAEERLQPDESFRIFQSLLHDCQRELFAKIDNNDKEKVTDS